MKTTILELIKEYFEKKIELFQRQAAEKVLNTAARIITILLVTLFLGGSFFFINIAVGILLGQVWGNLAYGFFALAGFYTFLVFLVYVLRKKMKTFILKKGMKIIFRS